MSAYCIASVIFKNEEDRRIYTSYLDEAEPIMKDFGGRIIVRGEKPTPASGRWLTGGGTPDMIIVTEFPSAEQRNRCFESEQYHSIRVLDALKASSVYVDALFAERFGEETA